ncbi:MAG: hypothetical protein IPL47_09575 [Phyllobacteriaceae bacterium]|nr:hypothetical protein [Phyllobacteriaceae bacterium]
MRSRAIAGRHLGWTADDLANKPWARFWKPEMSRIAAPVEAAVIAGPVAEPLLPGFEASRASLIAGDEGLENGFALCASGEMRIALATEMPGVTPAMVDWWFGWHSDSPERYKLWHPRAHVHAGWLTSPPADSTGRGRYVGQVSAVDEYIGSDLGRFAIAFLDPDGHGFGHASLQDGSATLVLARTGLADYPFDVGYLAHHVVAIGGGSLMRSRFWIGGSLVAARRGGAAGNLAASAIKTVLKPSGDDARALMVHCAQEMAHLATFLPALHGGQGGGS